MSYHLVTVFNIGDAHRASAIQELAIHHFYCQGIEEYTLDEAQVDEILGERSYSGGDLPLEVLAEVDEVMHRGDFHYKFYFSEADIESANKFLNRIKSEFLCEAQLETLDDQDWNAEWKKHYKPIIVDGGLVVLPEWESVEKFPKDLIVRIHPGMGFGTGSHETTFLCLKNFLKIQDKLPSKDFVLDYGSGSGILGLATLKALPEWHADMVDIDPAAHHNCLQNMELNEISEKQVSMLLLDERPLQRKYPLVFANILQNILHDECDYLIERTMVGGYLLLSGLLAHQVPETRNLYLKSSKVTLAAEEIKNDWGCLVLRRDL